MLVVFVFPKKKTNLPKESRRQKSSIVSLTLSDFSVLLYNGLIFDLFLSCKREKNKYS